MFTLWTPFCTPQPPSKLWSHRITPLCTTSCVPDTARMPWYCASIYYRCLFNCNSHTLIIYFHHCYVSSLKLLAFPRCCWRLYFIPINYSPSVSAVPFIFELHQARHLHAATATVVQLHLHPIVSTIGVRFAMMVCGLLANSNSVRTLNHVGWRKFNCCLYFITYLCQH